MRHLKYIGSTTEPRKDGERKREKKPKEKKITGGIFSTKSQAFSMPRHGLKSYQPIEKQTQSIVHMS
jgi:hypothetical protein